MNHNVFKDLVPNYIDNLTSEETNKLMEKHLMECKDCRDFLDAMREDLSLEIEDERRKDIKNVDYLKKIRSKNRKKTLIIVGSLLSVFTIILIALFIYLDWSLTPLPEEKRNISSSNVKMIVDLPDLANRTPIVRTYTKEEFDTFDEDEINKIKNIVGGNIEGDIPQLLIKDGLGIFEVSFSIIDEKDDYMVESRIIPDNTPEIKMILSETIYSEEELREIQDSLIVSSESSGIYSYEVKKYFSNEDLFSIEDDEPYRSSMLIEINYEINNKGYVSIFAINTKEDK